MHKAENIFLPVRFYCSVCYIVVQILNLCQKKNFHFRIDLLDIELHDANMYSFYFLFTFWTP